MHPRRPQPHLAPLMRTTMWPISPAVSRPTHGWPSRIRPPPTPVPQKTPSSVSHVLGRADLELGVGREVDVVAEADRRAAELLLERLAQVEAAASTRDRFIAPETVPFSSSTLPGEPTPTPSRSDA